MTRRIPKTASLACYRSGKRIGYSWSVEQEEGFRQRAAYVEMMGHEPASLERGTDAWEQWNWPNAKLRKRNRRDLLDVAAVEVGELVFA